MRSSHGVSPSGGVGVAVGDGVVVTSCARAKRQPSAVFRDRLLDLIAIVERLSRTMDEQYIPLWWTADPADGRWQTVAVVRGFYLADTEDTAWAEWYRHTSEQGAPPATRMPRVTWKIAVDVTDIADLTAAGVLAAHSIKELHPTRRQWTLTQPVGEAYFHDRCRGLLVPSAAREGGQVLTIFRPVPELQGLVPVLCPRRTTTPTSHRCRQAFAPERPHDIGH